MRVALDTNILAYAEGVNGSEKQAEAIELLERLPSHSTLLAAQTLGELFAVLVRKAKRPPADARRAMFTWGDAFPIIETSPEVLASAADLVADHQLFIWDAVILAAAVDGGCRLLLSEDLHDGFTWGGLTVTNPFGRAPHPLLDFFLSGKAH